MNFLAFFGRFTRVYATLVLDWRPFFLAFKSVLGVSAAMNRDDGVSSSFIYH